MKKLSQSFYEQSTLEVAKNLIGKVLVFDNKKAVITETEAYFGDDPASHGANGMTARNYPMFGPAGNTYVYFIYGMYYCLNFTTEKVGFPAAVLIRGIKMIDTGEHFDGPGKLCRALNITKKQNNIQTFKSKELYIADEGIKLKCKKKTRIGITKNIHKKWRFVGIEC